MLVQGIAQYIDLGAGLPTSPAVHQVVRRHSARAAVAYVDNDPVVLTHLHALAAHGDDRIREVTADLADPAATLAAVDGTGLIGWDRPCCLILGMVLHFQPAADAAAITAAYVSALPPGSYVIISIGRGDEQIGSRVTAAYDAARLFNHSPREVARFFAGLDLVPPGIVDARAWMPGWPALPYMLREGQILAGVGRKP